MGRANDADVELFTEIMNNLGDFCFQESASIPRDEHERQLKEQLDNGLAESKKMRGLNNNKIKAARKVALANEKEEDLDDELREARKDPSLKDEVPGLRDRLAAARKDLQERKAVLCEATLEHQAGLRENFDGVLSIHRKVSVGVGQVFQGVLLANGMSDCEFSLNQLFRLFGTTIRAYCNQTKLVYTSFLEDTAVVNPATATRLCLQSISDSQPVPAIASLGDA